MRYEDVVIVEGGEVVDGYLVLGENVGGVVDNAGIDALRGGLNVDGVP